MFNQTTEFSLYVNIIGIKFIVYQGRHGVKAGLHPEQGPKFNTGSRRGDKQTHFAQSGCRRRKLQENMHSP